jgi:hypothetical protein
MTTACLLGAPNSGEGALTYLRVEGLALPQLSFLAAANRHLLKRGRGRGIQARKELETKKMGPGGETIHGVTWPYFFPSSDSREGNKTQLHAQEQQHGFQAFLKLPTN